MKVDFWKTAGFYFIITNVKSLKSPDKARDIPVNGEKYNPRGTYKTKEEIEKAPAEDHPCNLTRTSVRISFPALKSETFVNLLGYKVPPLYVPKENKPPALAPGADSSKCSSTNRQNQPIQQNCPNYWTSNAI